MLDTWIVAPAPKGNRMKVRRAVGTAASALARRTRNSLLHHPMPELREVGREWRRSRRRAA
jgi:hypothetical protein